MKIVLSCFLAIALIPSGFACVVFQNAQAARMHSNVEEVVRCSGDEERQVNTTDRLLSLRGVMDDEEIAAYIVPIDREGRREWITGFTGSSGDAIVTQDQAACWTDSRYYIQAEAQLDCNWQLMKMTTAGYPDYGEWLTGGANLTKGSRVGADPSLIGAKRWLELRAELFKGGHGLILVDSLENNLVDLAWTEKPPFEPRDLIVHPVEFAGKSTDDKTLDLREFLAEFGYVGMVVSEGDEIAWLFNLRAAEKDSESPNPHNSPLFQSVALVTADQVKLWVHMDKVTDEIREHLPNVELLDYPNHVTDLETWSSGLNAEDKVLITQYSVYLTGANFALYNSIIAGNATFADSPVLEAKGVKNEKEVDGMISGHLKDAFALCEFAAFLYNEVEVKGNESWTELSAAVKLLEMRRAQELNKGSSFPAISASGSNAAIVHYSPTPETDKAITRSEIYMLDSGGQYQDGTTTDVTRTFHFGQPTAEMVEMYTRVLMGHVDLARAVFPNGTTDVLMDFAARQPQYEIGRDYGHGTGHGIGSYLSVHEGPTAVGRGGSVLKPNQFFSDEPGFYKEGEFGIRIESIMRVVMKEFDAAEIYGQFVGFDPVTMVPFEPKLIDFSLMHPEQIAWYNSYNALVVEKVVPHFRERQRQDVVDWILSKTERVDPFGNAAGEAKRLSFALIALSALVCCLV